MTIKDIARISGCSVSTISRVINDRPDVRPETKEHVLQIMREVGFVPNTNARQLKIQQSRSVVFVVKGTQNMFFADFLVHLQRVVVENFKRSFDQISIPAVLATVVSEELDFPNLSMVGVDDRAAAYQAVTSLIALGHRQICVIGGPATSHPSMMRRLGAQQAMEDNGLTFDPRLYGLSNYNFESAYNTMNGLLARRAQFTAVFAMSDVIAIGVIRALASAGYKVPDDVSVIGFDGISMSRYCVPALASMVQPTEELATRCVELLLRQIEHGAPAQTVVLAPSLQEGESVRPPRGAALL